MHYLDHRQTYYDDRQRVKINPGRAEAAWNSTNSVQAYTLSACKRKVRSTVRPIVRLFAICSLAADGFSDAQFGFGVLAVRGIEPDSPEAVPS
jgi:hypothetical protein